MISDVPEEFFSPGNPACPIEQVFRGVKHLIWLYFLEQIIMFEQVPASPTPPHILYDKLQIWVLETFPALQRGISIERYMFGLALVRY